MILYDPDPRQALAARQDPASLCGSDRIWIRDTVKPTPPPLTVLSRLRVDVCVVSHGAELSQRVISAKQEEEEGRAILQVSARSRARKQSVHATQTFLTWKPNPKKRCEIVFLVT
jgi:hypothetical protein